MGLMDSADAIVDQAAGLLGGTPAGPVAPPPPGKVEFLDGEPLDARIGQGQGADAGIQSGGDNPNALNQPKPIELIHFGRVHRDMNDNFPEPKVHGRHYRDALEREAILLAGFIASSKQILQEFQDSKSTAGDVLAMAGSLLGGGGQAGPSPAQFDGVMAPVKSVVGQVNVASITYPITHQAGVDLHKARASYVALAETALKPGAGGGGALPSLSSVLPDLPGPAKIVGDITHYAFSAFEVYLEMYRQARAEYEEGIEKACHDMTIATIKGNHTPTFPVWFVQDPLPASGQPSGPTGLAAADDVLSSVQSKKQAIEDLFVSGSTSRPGDAFLAAALGVLRGGTKRIGPGQTRKITPAPQLMLQAMEAAIGKGPLPPFIGTIVAKMAGASCDFIATVYRKLEANGPGAALNRQFLAEAVRETLAHKIAEAPFELLGMMRPQGRKQSQPTSLTSMNLGVNDALAKAIDEAERQLARLGRFADPIVEFMMEDLCDALSADLGDANSSQSFTMEFFLGRLPWVLALTVRNAVFPLFDLLLKVFRIGNTGLAAGLSPMQKLMGEGAIGGLAKDIKHRKDQAKKAKDMVDQGKKNLGDNVDAVKQQLGNQQIGTGSNTLPQLQNAVEKTGKDAQRDANNASDTATADRNKDNGVPESSRTTDYIFKGATRLVDGTGTQPKQSEINQAGRQMFSPE